MNDAELGLALKREADQVLFEDLHFGSRLKDVVRARLKTGQAGQHNRAGRPAAWLWRTAAAMVVMAALAVSTWPRVATRVGLGYYPSAVPLAPQALADEKGKTEGPTAATGLATTEDAAKSLQAETRMMAGGKAPRPFDYGLRAVADPYPVSLGETVSLSSERAWPGRHVWLYAAPSEDQATIFYDRLLPRDAILIGRAPIDANGQWSFDWTVPARLTHGDLSMPVAEGLGDYRQAVINLVAVTDTGYLAARGLEVGPPRSVAVQPESLAVGTVMTVSGSGYTPGIRLRLDLTHDNPDGGTDLQVNIGWATAGPDGRFTFDYTIPTQLNWPYADNRERMVDHVLAIGAPGTYSLVIVEYHPDQGPGPLLIKRLSVQTTP